MRRFIMAATAVGALAVAAIIPAVSAAAAATPCTGDLNGGKIPGALTVPAGATCKLFGTEVQGTISVAGTLVMDGAIADQNVTVDGGHFDSIGWGFLIKKNLSITNTPFDYNSNISGFWNLQAPGEIGGNFSYIHNNGQHLETQQGASVTVDGNFSYGDNYKPDGTYVPYAGGLTVLGNSTVATS
jgi:hypothetical protein